MFSNLDVKVCVGMCTYDIGEDIVTFTKKKQYLRNIYYDVGTLTMCIAYSASTKQYFIHTVGQRLSAVIRQTDKLEY